MQKHWFYQVFLVVFSKMLVFRWFSWFSWFFWPIQQISLYLSKKTKKTRKTKEKQAFLKSRPGKLGKTNTFALIFAESIVFTRYSMFIRIGSWSHRHVWMCVRAQLHSQPCLPLSCFWVNINRRHKLHKHRLPYPPNDQKLSERWPMRGSSL